MPDYEAAARRAALRHGVDPDVFVAQLKQESGLKMGVRSSAGARDIAQFMPGTAKAYGVTLGDGRARDDLDGAARYMADNLKQTGGDIKAALSIYNSGRPDAYKDPSFAGGQTYNYVNKIMGSVKAGPKVKAPSAVASPQAASTAVQTPAVPGTDNSGLRRQLVGQFLQQGGVKNSNAVLGLAAQYGQAQDTAGTPATYASTSGSAPKTPKVSNGSGALSALQWAESKVNAPGSAESGGENHGKLADYANSRFGMSGQAWCAMFTSLAVTKGGAPKSARTASVAEVRAKALAGDGYQKGLIDPNHAKPGDLVLFGDRHIGMVKGIKDGHLIYVGGNQSDSVTQAETGTSGVQVVRPKYGNRKK